MFKLFSIIKCFSILAVSCHNLLYVYTCLSTATWQKVNKCYFTHSLCPFFFGNDLYSAVGLGSSKRVWLLSGYTAVVRCGYLSAEIAATSFSINLRLHLFSGNHQWRVAKLFSWIKVRKKCLFGPHKMISVHKFDTCTTMIVLLFLLQSPAHRKSWSKAPNFKLIISLGINKNKFRY